MGRFVNITILNQNLSIVILDFVFPFISLKFALAAAHETSSMCGVFSLHLVCRQMLSLNRVCWLQSRVWSLCWKHPAKYTATQCFSIFRSLRNETWLFHFSMWNVFAYCLFFIEVLICNMIVWCINYNFNSFIFDVVRLRRTFVVFVIYDDSRLSRLSVMFANSTNCTIFKIYLFHVVISMNLIHPSKYASIYSIINNMTLRFNPKIISIHLFSSWKCGINR